MPSNPSGPIRRGQLIAPFGVGAMNIAPGGVSLIVAGLDHWYRQDDEAGANPVDIKEYEFQEWRLQKWLGVGAFRLPPDYRQRRGDAPNTGLTIPCYRFPTWHFCADCKLLERRSPYERGRGGRIRCARCQAQGKTRFVFQVPVIAICDQGHAQDFPWNEWIHRSARPTCHGPLELVTTGSATLAGQVVRCAGCKKERTLANVTAEYQLSKGLEKGAEYLCSGQTPWLGPDTAQGCGAYLRGSLRNASNVYYAQVRSSIYLPKLEAEDLHELEDLLQRSPLSTMVKLLTDMGASDAQMLEMTRSSHGPLLRKFSDQQIVQAVRGLITPAPAGADPASTALDWPTVMKREECETLRTERNEHFLKIRQAALARYQPDIARQFARIMLVDKLRETRAFAGFSRIFAENSQTGGDRQRLLWATPPADPGKLWLPAHQVYGEGIYFELSEPQLQDWERQPSVRQRVDRLAKQHGKVQGERHLAVKSITPRFVLIHTLAHLIINRLTFECGYSSAALRERLYVSDDPEAPMAGLLIYTADGDSEGTMGGLVRMGRPGNIEPVIRRALEGAQWCSVDPVCMEIGSQGQGPDSLNLAACHSCALVPETACEEFNRFLDRAVVIGGLEQPELGYFKQSS